jgi:hypothetical protein
MIKCCSPPFRELFSNEFLCICILRIIHWFRFLNTASKTLFFIWSVLDDIWVDLLWFASSSSTYILLGHSTLSMRVFSLIVFHFPLKVSDLFVVSGLFWSNCDRAQCRLDREVSLFNHSFICVPLFNYSYGCLNSFRIS